MKVTSEKDACKLSLSTCAGKRSISDSSEEESDTRTIIFDMEDIVYTVQEEILAREIFGEIARLKHLANFTLTNDIWMY